MTIVDVPLDPPYRVSIGSGVLAQAAQHSGAYPKAALLVDQRVAERHPASVASFEQLPQLEIRGGESAKGFGPLASLLEFLAEHGLDRNSALVTLGGGTIGDLGGLAASLYKRGIAVIHVPTTLLAQVDASVGGKTAINLEAGKNLVGTFHQPSAVYADTGLLGSLEDAEWRSGLGEVVKTAWLAGESEWAALEDAATGLAGRDLSTTAGIVAMCVRTKAAIVASDPTERGARRTLNLGHTFAHGIEHAAGYGTVPHGIAVAVGLRLALRASALLGRLETPELEARLTRLLGQLGLPTSLSEIDVEPDRVFAGMAHDKKGAVGSPELVLPLRPGHVELGVSIDGVHLLEILRSP